MTPRARRWAAAALRIGVVLAAHLADRLDHKPTPRPVSASRARPQGRRAADHRQPPTARRPQ